MATKKKLLQAAAGNAGGAGLNVEDLFSTNLWEGNSSQRDIGGGINLNTTDTTVGYESIGLNYFTTAQLGQYGAEQYNLGKIIEDSSGAFYASLSFKNTGNNYTQNVITKFSSTGSQVWSYRIQDTSNPKYASIADILFNSAGNVVVYWTPAGTNNQTRINIIDKDTGTILSNANNSSTGTHISSALQSGTNLYWAGKQNGKSLFINSDTGPASEIVSRRVDLGSYTQRHMLIPQSNNEPILVSTTSDQNSGSSTNGWVFTKLSSNLQSEVFSKRHSHSNGSSTQYSSRYMNSGKQYYDPSDNMLYCIWYGVNSSSGNTTYVNYISKFDMDDGSHVTSKRYYFNAVSNNNISPKSITKFGNNIICVASGNDGSNTQHIIMEFDTSLSVVSSRKVQLPNYTDALEIHAGSSSLFYFTKQDNSQAEIRKFSKFDITESVLNVAPTTGGFTITNTSLTDTTTGYNNVSISFNSASDTMNSGSNLTTQTIPLVTSQASVPLVEEVGSGGLVWIKSRSSTREHHLFDTERGVNKAIKTNSSGAEQNTSGGLTSFNFNGFSLGTYADVNGTSYGDFASWSFGKAEKFFTCLTYTGNGTHPRTISHNLGSSPGAVIIKKYSSTDNWNVFHRGLSSGVCGTGRLYLNATNSTENSSLSFFTPSSTSITLGSNTGINDNGATYVAYLFAHNDGDGDFGPDGDADIIKCGSFTGNQAAGNFVDLGFEPQFLLLKNASATEQWFIFDNMRGVVTGGADARLRPSQSNAESSYDNMTFNATGFTPSSNAYVNGSGHTMVYIAIRRGTKVPESATEVFAIDTANSTGNAPPVWRSGFPVDMAFYNVVTGGDKTVLSRMTGGQYLKLNATNAEAFDNDGWDFMDGWYDGSFTNSNFYSWMWKRAPNFFDVVAYQSGAQVVNHNLGVVPEMIWIKKRSEVSYYGFVVYHGTTGNMYLSNNFSSGYGGSNAVNHSTISNTTFQLANGNIDVNDAGENHIAYLFASLDGISKVGSVTHSGTTNVDCGFSSGSRFVLLKRTDASGDWYVWDSTRGIVSGNDPYLLLNTTAAEVTSTDYIDPLPSGFTITSSFTAGDYIFYAIA